MRKSIETPLALLGVTAAAFAAEGCSADKPKNRFTERCQSRLTDNSKKLLRAGGLSPDIAITEPAQERFRDGCERRGPDFPYTDYRPDKSTRDFLTGPYRRALNDVVRERRQLVSEAGTKTVRETEEQLDYRQDLITGDLSDPQELEEIAVPYREND